MKLDLYYGSPVSGFAGQAYASLIGEAVRDPKKTYYVLVPEQASLTVQEAIVQLHPDHILSNIDVVTFEKLAREVFSETKTETKDILDDLGKTMILRLVISEREKELGVLRNGVKREGMLSELKSVISEFAEYGVSPDVLRNSLEELDGFPALKQKLSDIALIYQAFLDKVHERYDIQEERLVRLSEVLPGWKALKNTVFLLNGFTGFTPPQYEVLNVLIRNASVVSVLLTLGSEDELEDQKAEEALFHMTYTAAETLKKQAIEAGAEITETRVTGVLKGLVSEEAASLERSFFRDREIPYESETDRIRIARLSNTREEVRFVVSEILSLIRKGMRYRDIAVISGDPERYREEIEDRMSDAGVPYFIDENRPVGQTVWYRFVESALEVTATGFGTDSVMDFIKNPIVRSYSKNAPGDADVYELENYVIAMGIRGEKRFQNEWTYFSTRFPEDRLPALNEFKSYLLSPLLCFSESLRTGGKKTEDCVGAVRKLLSDYRAAEGAEAFAKEAESVSGNAVTEEYRKIGEALYGFLDRTEEILAGFSWSPEAFRSVLKSGMDAMRIGRVPATKDRVVIGDVKRTRLGEVRHLFLIGANAGVLTNAGNEGGVINDADRAVLKDRKIALSGTSADRAYEDRYYLYRLFTSMRESLTVTYAGADTAGKPMKGAIVLGTLMRLFPKVRTESPEQDSRYGIVTERTGLSRLAASLSRYRTEEAENRFRGAKEEDRALYQWYEANDEGALRKLERGLYYRYRPEKLTESETLALYGNVIGGSVTRLERFAECPYRHFLQYGLKIRPRDIFVLKRSDIGSLLHNSIEVFFRKLESAGKRWNDISDSEQEQFAIESAAEAAGSYGNEIMNDSEKNQYLVQGVYRVLSRSLWALKKQWKDGRFTETESEVSFGERWNDAIRFDASDRMKVRLEGRVDRIDTGSEGNRIYLKIIDYKTSQHEPNYTKLDDGRQLQLFLYLKVAMDREKEDHPDAEIVPVGVYYFYLHDPILEKESENMEEERYQKFRMKGLTADGSDSYRQIDVSLEDQYPSASRVVYGLNRTKNGAFDTRAKAVPEETLKALADHALGKAKSLSKEIASGEIGLKPYESGCKYCEYRESCGFDRKLPGYTVRKEKKRSLKELTEEITDGMDK
ncbi:MAG: PD-(D/E)XK nuclease family protein [Lachnospiraceae bacterium]|nr:PD-(D/E)XK nuclease family protein [Lachnospiraceae bacterium]